MREYETIVFNFCIFACFHSYIVRPGSFFIYSPSFHGESHHNLLGIINPLIIIIIRKFND